MYVNDVNDGTDKVEAQWNVNTERKKWKHAKGKDKVEAQWNVNFDTEDMGEDATQIKQKHSGM